MKIKVAQRKVDGDEFLKERQEVLSQWPTGKDVDLEEAVEYHKGLPESSNWFKVMEKLRREGRTGIFPRAGTPILEDEIKLNRRMVEAGVFLIPITTDSYSRLGQFRKAQEALEESIRTRKPKLNGFPIVNHGVRNIRKVLEANEAAYDARFNGADSRLLADVSIASGITSVLSDPSLTLGCYTKDAPPEQIIKNYQYIWRLVGHYEERGVRVIAHLNSWLPHGVFPQTIILVSAITCAVLAAEQGAKGLIGTVQLQGNLAQDIAGVRVLRSLMREYLDRFGYQDVVVAGIEVGPMESFPCPRQKETALAMANYVATTAALAGAEVCSARTLDEAAGIPNVDAHGVTYESMNWILNVLTQQKLVLESKDIDAEVKLLEAETRAIIDRILELGDADIAIGYVRGVESGVIDSPMCPNVHVKSNVLGVRDNKGAARYLEFGNLPIPEEIKEFHRQKVAKREQVEGRKMDYRVCIGDFWAPSKGFLIDKATKPLLRVK
jgi:methylaspartate mutase epsilon subunit